MQGFQPAMDILSLISRFIYMKVCTVHALTQLRYTHFIAQVVAIFKTSYKQC